VVLEKNFVVPSIEDQYQHVINLANSVGGEGFEDMTVGDDNQENEDLNKASSSSSNSKALLEHLDMLAKGADFLREIDPSPDLGQKFHREHTQLIKRYEELLKN
jgi:hypothetical protein